MGAEAPVTSHSPLLSSNSQSINMKSTLLICIFALVATSLVSAQGGPGSQQGGFPQPPAGMPTQGFPGAPGGAGGFGGGVSGGFGANGGLGANGGGVPKKQ
ncbi:FAM10 family protein At4g22670-like [Tribolium madens]|uniref:FAM10 family protein At4g22670-like n=1 Tax=Tribolium madens TaxID=41895 RepID=UPI001CF71F53|nr:FAM10 family protein At4g22670-like [Tribolium madens]